MNLKVFFDSTRKEEKDLLSYLKTSSQKFESLDISDKRQLFSVQSTEGIVLLISEDNPNQLKSLKKSLEYLSSDLRRKPAGIITYSSKRANFFRKIGDFKLFLLDLEIFPIKDKLRIIKNEKNYEENGNIYKFLEQLNWWAKALKNERVNRNLNVKVRPLPQENQGFQNSDTLDSFITSSFWKN